MEGITEKDCSPLWNLYQQIVSDMKNSTPMWEEFISKATKLHSALKSALVAIAAFLDAFQKIADAATNARGATKEIGTALTRVCLRHRAIETRVKTFLSALMDTLITPLSDRADEWRRGSCATGALSREHARECKRARAELRRRVTEAQRHARKARRAPPDAKRRVDVCMQDIQERKQQLEEMEEKAVKAALIEERSRFCHFVSLLNPVVECEVAMLAEVGHLQEGSEQLVRHTTEPRTLPAASLQVICDVKSSAGGWAESGSAPQSPAASRLGSRKSSLTSISSLNSQCSDQHGVSGSTVSCSTPISNASSAGTIPAPGNDSQLTQSAYRLSSVCSADSGFRSQDALQRRSLYVENGSDNQSVSSECVTPAKSIIEDDNSDDSRDVIGNGNAASATWPDLKDTAQFERAATAIMGGRPHTISAAYERGHPRPALSVHTFTHSELEVSHRDTGIYARPPLPTRCSSLERPAVPLKTAGGGAPRDLKPSKPSSLPPHLTKEMPQALYVNMSELATLAASRAQQHQHAAEHPQQEKVCSESSASESSLESSSGYGSQGAFAAEDHAHQHHVQHPDVESEIVTLRRDSDASVAAARENFSISLGSLEEAVRSLDEATETPAFATIGKKPAVPKRRPLSMTAAVWSRRGSASSLGKPPPPVRRSSSISRPQRPAYGQGNIQSPQVGPTDADNLPPPPAFLLQPDQETNAGHQINVAETVKQLTELKHMPASPSLGRRAGPAPAQPGLTSFHQPSTNYSSNTSLNSSTLNPIYAHTMHNNSVNSDIYRETGGIYGESKSSPHGSTPSTPSYGENNSFSSFGPRVSNDSHYGQTGLKMQQERQYGRSAIYAQPSEIIAGFNSMARHDALSPLALRKSSAARSHSADRHHIEQRGLIASLSAKLAPQLSPRTTRRAISTITAADPSPKGKGVLPAAVQPAFLDKLSATIQQQQRRHLDSPRAGSVRDIINAHAQNSTPMWEEFISKATKLHSALKSALVAIAAFLDAFQKIADAATNARGATKEIGTALTRVCLRHRAIETRVKTFLSALMDTLITPLSDRADEWRRGSCATGALSREHARECKRARAELRRRVTEAQRHARKARRAPPDAKRRVDVCMQDIQERKQQLEEMEEKAVKAALIEERSRFCHFVSLLNPVVECEVAMLAEVGHLQEGSEQLVRHTTEPRTLPAASLQVICDVKSSAGGWAESGSAPQSPAASRLGSRKSSLTSISSLNSQCSDQHGVSGSTVSCSTPISNASSAGTIPAPGNDSQLTQSAYRLSSVCSADSGFRSQDALQRRSLYVENGSDNQSVSSECVTPAKSIIEDDNSDDSRDVIGNGNAASATWPDLKDTAQFERAATAIMGGRPHTISAAYERGHPRPALSVHTFTHSELEVSHRDTGIYARPPLPTRCSSLERPAVPLKTAGGGAPRDLKPSKPSSLPPHLTKEMPQALYVNMSELATLAASRAQQHQHAAEHPQQEKVCSESSASESSLESSSGYGSQGAFAAEDHAHQHHVQHPDVESEIVTLRRDSDASVAAARENFSISLGSLEEAVRSLDEATETPAFATIGKKPAVPKRRPLSMTAAVWSRRGSASSLGKPPPPVRRSSSISRPQRPAYGQGNIQSPQVGPTDADNLPPPPAFLLQPDQETNAGHQINVAETVKQLTELKHMPASPSLGRRAGPAPAQPGLTSFHQPSTNYSSNTSLNSSTLNPIYAHTMHNNSVNSDIYRETGGIYGESKSSPHGSTPSTPSYGENNSFSSFGPRVSNDSHYGQTGLKMQQERQYGRSAIYAQPSEIIAGFNSMARHDALSPLALRKSSAARSHSADRHHIEQRGLIASLSAKLAPQLSPRTTRRAISTITAADPSPKGKGVLPAAVQPAFLDKLSATIQQQQRRHLDSPRAGSVRDIINAHAQPDPRVCHTSLMEQIKRGATLRRNKHCNDRSAPKIR